MGKAIEEVRKLFQFMDAIDELSLKETGHISSYSYRLNEDAMKFKDMISEKRSGENDRNETQSAYCLSDLRLS